MDTRETLAAIAKTLPALPPDGVESTLLSFDTLVHFGEQEHRPEAANFLRDAAEQCDDSSRKERLMRAADALVAGDPLALTADGQTWQQAAAAQTVGIDEWVEPPEPVYPPEEIDEEEEEDDEDELVELDELAELEDELDEDEEEDEDED
jgi:hypothetical protein